MRPRRLDVRFLICPGGGYGNLHPLVPLAGALADRDHTVVFATSPIHLATVELLGFEGFAVGPTGGIDEFITGATRRELERADGTGRATRVIEGFTALAEATIPDLTELVRHWRPDVLLRDTTAFGAWIAGDQAGVPVALFDFAGFPPALTAAVAAPPLDRLRRIFGLRPDPDLRTMYRWLVLVGAPPGWTDLNQLASTAHLIAPPEFDRASLQTRPAWLGTRPAGRPLVYATLGTVFADSAGARDAIFAAAADNPHVDFVATIGPSLDPTAHGAVAGNVRVERYVPQSYVLDVASAVIAHAGYGTLMSAVRRGLPIVSLPMAAADNLLNASRLSALGAGIVLDRHQRTPEAIGHALRRVLDEPAIRRAARNLADATASLPSSDDGARLIERLASTRRPIHR